MESYVERLPLPGLAGVVRTVWIQRTGEAAYVQRHLPTGGVEIHFLIGGHPQLVGPLTGPEIEVILACTTIVGVRFQPGTAPPLPAVLDDLLDQRLGLAELWGSSADRLVEAMAGAGTAERHVLAGPPRSGVPTCGPRGSAGGRSREGADALAPGQHRHPGHPPGTLREPAAPPLPARSG